MTAQLASLTPVSLHSALGHLHRRVLQKLAKDNGLKANQKSEALVSSLFDRFAAGLDELAGDGRGNGANLTATAGSEEAPVQKEVLSPVSNGGRYSAEGEVAQQNGTAAHSMPAASPLPGSLEGAVNPLFFLGGQDGREEVQEEPEGQEEQKEQEGQLKQEERQQSAAKTLPAPVQQRGTAAGAAGGGLPMSKGPQAKGKRKAAEEAPQEGPPPPAKRQAHNNGGSAATKQTGTADQENEAGSTKAAADPVAGSAALRATNSAAAAGKAAPGKGGVPAVLPKVRPSTSGASLSVRERKAEEAHAARRAAALAKAGQRGMM